MADNHPPDDEAALFRSSIGAVRRLRHDRHTSRTRPPAPVPRQRLDDERRVLEDSLSDDYDPVDLETGEELSFSRPGIQHGVLRRLRRGQLSVQAELDLHGLSVPAARESLADFLRECRRSGTRCVRIVHGKGRRSPGGQGVLKDKVNRWLRQWDAVLAFNSARPVDGGTGALYVLLKR